MPATEAPISARVTAAFSALAFCGAGVSWGLLATIGFWAPSQYRIEALPHDVIPGVISACLMLISFQFAQGAVMPSHLPMGGAKRHRPISIGRFGVRLATSALFGFMGFVLLSMAASHTEYAIFDVQNKVIGLGDPQRAWMPFVQRYSGLALIIVSCLALVTHTRQFLALRAHTASTPNTAPQNG